MVLVLYDRDVWVDERVAVGVTGITGVKVAMREVAPVVVVHGVTP